MESHVQQYVQSQLIRAHCVDTIIKIYIVTVKKERGQHKFVACLNILFLITKPSNGIKV